MKKRKGYSRPLRQPQFKAKFPRLWIVENTYGDLKTITKDRLSWDRGSLMSQLFYHLPMVLSRAHIKRAQPTGAFLLHVTSDPEKQNLANGSSDIEQLAKPYLDIQVRSTGSSHSLVSNRKLFLHNFLGK